MNYNTIVNALMEQYMSPKQYEMDEMGPPPQAETQTAMVPQYEKQKKNWDLS